MLAYTPVSEAGGVGKTTTAATLAVAHARAGLDVLAIDMDAQNGSLSYLFGAEYDRGDSNTDNLVRHLVNRPKGDFEGLIHEVEHGVDLIPSHNLLEDLTEFLLREKQTAEQMGEAYSMYRQLHRVLSEANVRDNYDVLIIDTPGKADPVLYNALVAVQNVVIPLEASGKGQQSIDGLNDLVAGLEEQLGIGVGVLAVVPTGVKGTSSQQRILEEIDALGFDVPAVIGDRTSLMEGCWLEQCSPYTFVEEHRDRERDYEMETLAQFDQLARALEAQAGITAPVPDADTEVSA